MNQDAVEFRVVIAQSSYEMTMTVNKQDNWVQVKREIHRMSGIEVRKLCLGARLITAEDDVIANYNVRNGYTLKAIAVVNGGH